MLQRKTSFLKCTQILHTQKAIDFFVGNQLQVHVEISCLACQRSYCYFFAIVLKTKETQGGPYWVVVKLGIKYEYMV